jgi:hypothetical protein
MTDPNDALDLTILHLHRDNLTDAQIARQTRQTRQRVTARRRRIITEDCLCDPTADAYWHPTRETPT